MSVLERMFRAVAYALAARPMPHFLCALYLSLRWMCYVPFDCRIYFPFRVRIGRFTRFYGRVTLIADGPIEIGSSVEIYEGSVLQSQGGSIRIGNNSAIGPHVVIYGGGHVTIGRDCSIATKCTIVSTNHTYSLTSMPIRRQGYSSKPVEIADDVWLCAGVVVAYGVSIGTGCIVGANSLVKRDLPAHSISLGVPADVMKLRPIR